MERHEAYRKVHDELETATHKFPPFNTPHEGYAVILEELDELWGQVKIRPLMRVHENLVEEATQVAAMAIRFLTDLC